MVTIICTSMIINVYEFHVENGRKILVEPMLGEVLIIALFTLNIMVLYVFSLWWSISSNM